MAKKVFFHSKRKVAKWMELYLILFVILLLSSPAFIFLGMNHRKPLPSMYGPGGIPEAFIEFQRDMEYIRKATYTAKDMDFYIKKKAGERKYNVRETADFSCPGVKQKSLQIIHPEKKAKLAVFMPYEGKKTLDLLYIPFFAITRKAAVDFILYPASCSPETKNILAYSSYILLSTAPQGKTYSGGRIYGAFGLASSIQWMEYFSHLREETKSGVNPMLRDSFFAHRKTFLSQLLEAGIPAIEIIPQERNGEIWSAAKSIVFIREILMFQKVWEDYHRASGKQKEMMAELLPLRRGSFWISSNTALTNWGKWYLGIFIFLFSFVPLVNAFALRNESITLISLTKAVIYSAFAYLYYINLIMAKKFGLETPVYIILILGIVLVVFFLARSRIRNFINMQDNVVSNMAMLTIILILLSFYQPIQFLFFYFIALSIFQIKMRSYFSLLFVLGFLLFPLLFTLWNPMADYFSQIQDVSTFMDAFFPDSVAIGFFSVISGFFISMLDTDERKR